MARKIRKAVKLGARIAAAVKSRLARNMKMLVKSGIVNRKEAQRLAKVLTVEVRAEKERIKQFAKAELKRGLKRVKPLVKKAVSRMKKARRR